LFNLLFALKKFQNPAHLTFVYSEHFGDFPPPGNQLPRLQGNSLAIEHGVRGRMRGVMQQITPYGVMVRVFADDRVIQYGPI
jgi:hypothetical protein